VAVVRDIEPNSADPNYGDIAVRIYVDGQFDAGGSWQDQRLPAASDGVRIGHWGNYSAVYDGTIDELRLSSADRTVADEEWEEPNDYGWWAPYDCNEPNTIALFHFDEGSGTSSYGGNPISPTAYTVSFDGTGEGWVSGQDANFASALDFEGTSGSTGATTLGSYSELGLVGSGPSTAEAWVKVNSYSWSGSAVIAKSFIGGWLLQHDDDGRIRYTGYTPSGWGPALMGTTAIPAGEWHHVAVVRDINPDSADPNYGDIAVRIYVDGQFDAGGSWQDQRLPAASDGLRIGHWGNYSSVYDGTIDELRLSSADRTVVDEEWEEPNDYGWWAPYDCNEPNTIALFHFDEGSGTSSYGGNPISPTIYPVSFDGTGEGWVSGQDANFASALDFEGATNYTTGATTTGSYSELGLVDSGSSTYEAWVKVNSYSWTYEATIAKSITGGWILQHSDDGRIYVTWYTPGGWGPVLTGTTAIPAGEWHHVAVVRDIEPNSADPNYCDIAVKIYIDGECDAKSSWQDQYSPSASDGLRIGHWGNYTTAYDGTIDELRLSSADRATKSDSCEKGKYIPGDINGDCYVDFADFASVAMYWLQCNDSLESSCITFDWPADIDGDYYVDYNDVAYLVTNWLTCNESDNPDCSNYDWVEP
jgi:hypothetical protein